MTSKLGVYWSVEHRRESDYAYFKALQPSVHLVMDGGPPDYAFVRDNEPSALTLARDWALSEQHSDMLANPVGTGQRHAQEWNEHQPRLGFNRAKTLILGINEPMIWEPGVPEALRQYTIALCDEATRRNLRVGAMQLGVGWPGNNGPDTPPDWSPFHGVEEAILRGNHALITHEYWADQGPSETGAGGAGRTLKCPWQVPIIIGECGVDMFVKDTSVGQQKRGWFGNMPPERYAAELWEYTGRMEQDPRFVGDAAFASDFQAHEWYSFDVEPAYKAILAVKPADTPPVDTFIPSVGTGTPQSDNWQRSIAFLHKWEGGFQDFDWDVGNWTGCEVGKGEKKGTNFGISACSYPNLDIRNLTQEQADDIFRRDYWQKVGADKLPWPYCLVAFDTAVLHGTGAAEAWLAEYGDNLNAFVGRRLHVYTKSKAWQEAGAGWVNRVADLMLEAAK